MPSKKQVITNYSNINAYTKIKIDSDIEKGRRNILSERPSGSVNGSAGAYRRRLFGRRGDGAVDHDEVNSDPNAVDNNVNPEDDKFTAENSRRQRHQTLT